MRLEFTNAAERPSSDTFETFNRAFAGYVGGSVTFDAKSFSGFLTLQNINLALSRLALQEGEPVGFGLVARRGWTSRLAAMGVVPEASGQGVGTRLLEGLLEEARGRGDRRYTLEVIEQNPRAVALYQKLGFSVRQRLLEFEAHQLEGERAGLESLDIAEVARLAVQHGDEDLPWQLDGYSLVQQGPPSLAYRLGPSCAVIGNPAGPVVRLHSLLTLPAERRRGHATRLLRALFAHYPGKRWHLPALCPEPYAPVLGAAGFRRGTFSQFQMERRLEPGSSSP